MEIWKTIEGTNGKYSVSNMGRIISPLGKYIGSNKENYRSVRIMGMYLTIHRLVALHFIPNPNNKRTVNHKDGNKHNNNVSNLEWNTHSENILHAYRTGLKKCTEKTKITSGSRFLGNNFKSRPVLDLYTGIFFMSLSDVARSLNINRNALKSRVRRNSKLSLRFMYI